nr:MAG TPA: hypothetical protein [Caudoviricetes sp.]DAS20286.1 MAG TPA: hypothetical protein [Caudoviricetes sp.]
MWHSLSSFLVEFFSTVFRIAPRRSCVNMFFKFFSIFIKIY